MSQDDAFFDPQLLDQLLDGHRTAEGFNGLLKQLSKGLLERALEAELTHHLGHERGGKVANEARNVRNGKSKKTIQAEFGQMELAVPRDRHSEFEPQILPKHQRRFEGLDEKILSLYAHGMTTRDIQSQLQTLYGVDVSPALISEGTDAVLDEVQAWRSRPLEAVYPIVSLDCLHVRIRKDGLVAPRAVYTAVGITLEGNKDVLGLWVSDTEGAKFWARGVASRAPLGSVC